MPPRKAAPTASKMARPLTERAYRRRIARAAKEHYELRLYVAGPGPLSSQAIQSINSLCEAHLQGRYHLEVIDIHQQPQAVLDGHIIAAPTLVKTLPLPARRFTGGMGGGEKLMSRLNMIANPVGSGGGCEAESTVP